MLIYNSLGGDFVYLMEFSYSSFAILIGLVIPTPPSFRVRILLPGVHFLLPFYLFFFIAIIPSVSSLGCHYSAFWMASASSTSFWKAYFFLRLILCWKSLSFSSFVTFVYSIFQSNFGIFKSNFMPNLFPYRYILQYLLSFLLSSVVLWVCG